MESSGTKVYIGNCEGLSEAELRNEFSRFGRVENKVWIARNPPGFAFIWFEDERDANDAVNGLDGKQLCGKTLRVELSNHRVGGRRDRNDRDGGDRYSGGGHRGGDRGYDDYSRGYRGTDRRGYGGSRNDGYGGSRGGGRGGGYGRGPTMGSRGAPRKTGYKVRITNLGQNTHWTDLKDFARKVGEVIYTNVENGEGIAEFADKDGMDRAFRELDDTLLGDRRIRVELQDESDRYRKFSVSPPRYGRSSRDRSPPRRDRGGYSRSPPRRRSRSRSPRY